MKYILLDKGVSYLVGKERLTQYYTFIGFYLHIDIAVVNCRSTEGVYHASYILKKIVSDKTSTNLEDQKGQGVIKLRV